MSIFSPKRPDSSPAMRERNGSRGRSVYAGRGAGTTTAIAGESEPYPATAVLVLSHLAEEAYALELLSESPESTGYLIKARVSDVASFTDAARRLADGGSALDTEVDGQPLRRRRRDDPLAALSPREREGSRC
jgi:DNA-binding NarL/FixJ family response regulator